MVMGWQGILECYGGGLPSASVLWRWDAEHMYDGDRRPFRVVPVSLVRGATCLQERIGKRAPFLSQPVARIVRNLHYATGAHASFQPGEPARDWLYGEIYVLGFFYLVRHRPDDGTEECAKEPWEVQSVIEHCLRNPPQGACLETIRVLSGWLLEARPGRVARGLGSLGT